MDTLIDAGGRVWGQLSGFMPTFFYCLVVLLLTIVITRKSSSTLNRLLKNRIESRMLRLLVARVLSVPIFIIGFYIVLDISGLRNLAATLIGGTGLLGIVIGIAFRNITENFLASILLSIQRPFVLGDMIRVLEYVGMVEAMTTRGTVLITLDGNHVQIPNTTIYKEPIVNYSSNPNIRQNFILGIGYGESVSNVQSIVMEVLKAHDAVLSNPEPLVLAEEMASSSVNLGVYFWVNGHLHSALKVKSSVIRLVKLAMLEHGIDMPDDAREVIFPQGMPVLAGENENLGEQQVNERKPSADAESDTKELGTTANQGEGNLTAEKETLQEQGKTSNLGQSNTNLLYDG